MAETLALFRIRKNADLHVPLVVDLQNRRIEPLWRKFAESDKGDSRMRQACIL